MQALQCISCRRPELQAGKTGDIAHHHYSCVNHTSNSPESVKRVVVELETTKEPSFWAMDVESHTHTRNVL